MILLISFTLLVFLGFLIKNSKVLNWLEIVLLTITVGIGTNVADFSAYNRVYQFIGNGNYYPNTGNGWWLLCKLGNMFGLSYEQFKMLILFVGLLIIRSTIKYFTNNPNYIWSLYLIYPVITDLIQIRFFVGLVITIWAVRYLVSNTPRGYIIYFISILVAGQVHNSAYFYLIFIFWKFVTKNIQKVVIGLVLFLGICLVEKNILINIISSFGTGQENEFYLNNTLYQPTATQMVFFTLVNTTFILVSKYIRDSIYASNQIEISKAERNYVDFMLAINIMAIVILVMAVFSFTFFRLQKPLWLLNYINVVIFSTYIKKGPVSPGIIIAVYAFLGAIALIGTESQALNDFFFVLR